MVDCFAVAGILLGLIVTICAYSIRNTLYNIVLREEETLRAHSVNLTGYINGFEWIGGFGIIQIIFGLFGLASALSGNHWSILIYLIYVVAGTLISLATTGYCMTLAFTGKYYIQVP